MIFNSLIFIFCFFPISIILYYLIPTKVLKNIILLILSLIFYAWANPVTLIILILSILWNFITGIELGTEENKKVRKIQFWIAIGFNIFLLVMYKYLDFLLPFSLQSMPIPMGLSFFTFTSISYLVDVYTQKVEYQKSILNFSLYISFFGKISMGPITQYHEMKDQLSFREINKDNFGQGMQLFVKGLIKKVLLADQFALVFSQLSNNSSVLGAWFYALAYMFEIYFDFSGYSDMAIGISKIFGFDIKPNFDHPYVARSIQDFWRRWHISLSQWFRDYIYIPLGGSRVSKQFYIRNILIVWLCTGIWHGANWTFIVWGFYYAVFLLLEKLFLREKLNTIPSVFSHIYTLLVVLISWVFFFSGSLQDAFSTLGLMFGVNTSAFLDDQFLFVITSNIVLFVLGIFFSTKLFDRIQILFFNFLKEKAIYTTTLIYFLCFIVCIAFIIGSTYKSFLYFAF